MLRITRGKAKPRAGLREDRAANLRPRCVIPRQCGSEKFAAEAVGAATDDAEKVRKPAALYGLFLRDSYEVERSRHGLLKSRKGECSAHACCCTTFARRAGIPAREAAAGIIWAIAYQHSAATHGMK